MIVGCYTLHLYCDNDEGVHAYGEFPHQYTAEYGSQCRKDARRDGWQLDQKNYKAYCPKCVKKVALSGATGEGRKDGE